MRFRAKIVDVGCLNHFTRVINTVARLAKNCTLRLTVDKLYFILSDKVANGGVSMWCELNQGNFFDELQMEGVAAENNEIYLEVTSENLSRALKTAQNAKAVKLKLTNKQCPCLTVAVELVKKPSSAYTRVICSPVSGVAQPAGICCMRPKSAPERPQRRPGGPEIINQPSLSSSNRIVTHDIPVDVIPRKLWIDFREPNVPECDVSIYLPVMKTMKSVVERMKNLSNFIVIEANKNGEMNLKIETELVCVTTHFKELGNPPWVSAEGSQNSTQDSDLVSMMEVRIDIRRLLQFLAGQQVNPMKALCNIVSKRMICFILLHEDFSLQYFIPALA